MRAGLKCFTVTSDLWGGRAVAFEEHRPDEEQQVVHVMCSVRTAEDEPAVMGSVPMPNAWEAVVIHG